MSTGDKGTAPFLRGDRRMARLCEAATVNRQKICSNPSLSEAQRHTALELLLRRTEEELRRLVGPREFQVLKAFHSWWFSQPGESAQAAAI